MRSSLKMGAICGALFGGLALGSVGCSPTDAKAETLAEDTFVARVLGEWQGSGEYDGNVLTLTRSWTLELGNEFLRSDMRVVMPNGVSFGALMYWKTVSRDIYDVVWMDGIGRLQELHATRDPDSGLVSTIFLDQLAESGPEWRSWEFESLGPNAYVERLYRVVAGGREVLAEFSFSRVGEQ